MRDVSKKIKDDIREFPHKSFSTDYITIFVMFLDWLWFLLWTRFIITVGQPAIILAGSQGFINESSVGDKVVGIKVGL